MPKLTRGDERPRTPKYKMKVWYRQPRNPLIGSQNPEELTWEVIAYDQFKIEAGMLLIRKLATEQLEGYPLSFETFRVFAAGAWHSIELLEPEQNEDVPHDGPYR